MEVPGMKRALGRAWVLLLTVASGTTEAGAADEFQPVTDAMLAAPPGADWLGYRGNLAGWGYSELDQVTPRNVATLTLAWAWPLDDGINETTPLVHDGILYIVNPGGAIQALDTGTADLIWEYRRKVPVDLDGAVGSPIRNLAVYGDSIFSVTVDGHLIALSARTGALRWEVETGDYHSIMQSTGPIAADGKVFTGRSCAPAVPGGCYILAHDAATGQELWRRYVIPRPGEPGDDTWAGLPLEERRHVGAWGPGSYDPELDLLYWGTSVPSPSLERIRGTPGADLLYSNSTLALDADSGDIVWHFQHLPRDNWDLDHTSERMLVDSPVRPEADSTWARNPRLKPGARRRLMTGIPGKTGIVWTLDRATGEFLWARETVRQNVVRSIDPATGKVTIEEGVIPSSDDGIYGLVCPSNKGGKVWQVGAYHPGANAIYMPLQRTCMEPEVFSRSPAPADGYGLVFNMDRDPEADSLGVLEAISVETGETLWRYSQRAGMFSVLAMAGGLVFAGDGDRRFRAFDAESGDILWETVLQGPVTGAPVSFEANGAQYVAVAAGGGDWLSVAYNSLADLPTVARNNVLYVFALPENAPARDQTLPAPDTTVDDGAVPTFRIAQAKSGAAAYEAHCLMCHGEDMQGTSLGPALRGHFFLRRWGGRPLADLFTMMSDTMPLQAPDSLDKSTIADILAYWAQLNGYSASDKEMAEGAATLSGYTIRLPH
jgi:alcohol dehydrogenase (cytochrome c)